ncbi:MAG: iron-sulfur cluster assembly scaffold protein [Parcubacteria group bacterium]|jgi:nitrogen fixation NifU-like protein
MYSKKVLQYFMKPKNQGKMKDPDGVGMVGNPTCGDIMTMYIKVKKTKDKEIISDIKFETLGCAAAIATSSMVTEMAKGKSLDDAFKISRQSVADELEGLPPAKMHCSNLAEGALKRAIDDYRSKAGGSKAKAPEKTKKASAVKKKKK